MSKNHKVLSFGIFFSSLIFVSSLAFFGCSDGGSDSSSPVTVSQPKQDNPGGNGKVEEKEKQGGNESSRTIKLSDAPVGYAAVTAQTGTGTTVSTRSDLLSAISNGGLIYVKGTIDMSDGMLPSVAGGSTTKLDDFVKTQTTSLNSKHSDLYPNVYTKYVDFKNAYANLCSSSTDDKSSSSTTTALSRTLWKLNPEYGKIIKINVGSNTTIIGLADAVIKGGTFQISNASNVIIRNITIKDAYDPFPHHEKNDGFNAQWDCISIDSSTNVWLDHCTFEDTMKYSMVKINNSNTEEKWQIYDGMCDMKNDTTNVTISNCIFKNHDKTMLIGSDDSDGDNTKRFVTLYGNYFLNCVQRLPMVRNTTIHIFNNYYDTTNSTYENDYAIGRRKNCIVYAENNYFGSGIKYSVKETNGELHSSGNEDKSSKKSTAATDSALFSSLNKYTYTAVSASDAKKSVLETAGAGCILAD